MNIIYKNIKLIRERKGLSQQQMANKLNMVVSAYGKIERSQTQLTIERLHQIATIFEMSIADILSYKHLYKEDDSNDWLKKLIKENDTTLEKYREEVNDLVHTKFIKLSMDYVETKSYHELDDWDLVLMKEFGIETEEEYLKAGQPCMGFTRRGDEKAFIEIFVDDNNTYTIFTSGLITEPALLVLWDKCKDRVREALGLSFSLF